jgi:hypothetical protein
VSSLIVFISLVGVALLSGLGRRSNAARGTIGAEFVVGGIIVGPALLGLVQGPTLAAFIPLILMSIGWLAAATGMHHGLYRGRFVGAAGYTSGVLVGTLFLLGFCAGVWLLGRVSSELRALDARTWWIFVCMAGAALGLNAEYRGESGRFAASIRGRLRAGMSSGGTLPMLLGLCAVVAFDPPKLEIAWPNWAWSLFGPLLGAVFGGTVAALLGQKFRFSEFWPVVIGAVLLVAGLAARFQLSLVATAFALGVCLVGLSPHRGVIRELAARAAAPIHLPLAVVAGALVTWPRSEGVWILAAALVFLRLTLQYGFGFLVATVRGVGRGHQFGLSLLPVGHLGLAAAMLARFRLPEPVGKVVLLSVCLSAILGQLLGNAALERLSEETPGSEPEPEPLGSTSEPDLDRGHA